MGVGQAVPVVPVVAVPVVHLVDQGSGPQPGGTTSTRGLLRSSHPRPVQPPPLRKPPAKPKPLPNLSAEKKKAGKAALGHTFAELAAFFKKSQEANRSQKAKPELKAEEPKPEPRVEEPKPEEPKPEPEAKAASRSREPKPVSDPPPAWRRCPWWA